MRPPLLERIWRSDFPKSTNPFRFFLFSSSPHAFSATLGILSVIVAGTLYSAGIPYSFKIITDAVTQLGSGGSYDAVVWAAIAYIVITTTAHLIWRVSGYAGSFWAIGARATARHALTAYVTQHSRSYFSDRFAGSVSNKIGHASNGVRDMVDKVLWEFLSLGVSVAASFVIAFITSPKLGAVFVIWVTVIVAVNIYFGKKRAPLSAKAQSVETALTGATVDLLSNITAMQEYARRSFEIDRLKIMMQERRVAGLRNWHYGEHILTFNGLLQAVFAAIMVLLALRLASNGLITTGDVVLILTLIFRIEDQFLFMGAHINRLSETWGEMRDSLDEILLPHEMPDKDGAEPLKITAGVIDFHRVSFGYGDSSVFTRLNLRIPSRQRVGIVGTSGAGKSTLVRLLMHHYELQTGVISIDGVNIADVTRESLRENISVVPQEPLLFHRTIEENIAYGNPGASRGEIERAAQLAHAHDFIMRLPSGYASLVGERGVKLSGGERQRIAIARAILKDSPILILDEATASLDSESEVSIQKALHELMQNKTVIAIAHRLSTLREMDRILVLEEGRIIEDGTHAALLTKRGRYSDLWNHQAGGFIADDEDAMIG